MAIEHLGEVVVGMKTDEVMRLLENVQAGGGIVDAAGGSYLVEPLSKGELSLSKIEGGKFVQLGNASCASVAFALQDLVRAFELGFQPNPRRTVIHRPGQQVGRGDSRPFQGVRPPGTTRRLAEVFEEDRAAACNTGQYLMCAVKGHAGGSKGK